MSEPTSARPWTLWLDRLLWVGVAAFFLVRCVLPQSGEPPGQALASVRVATAGQPTLVVFDGSR